MQTELLWPLALFVFVTAVTPGPNNIMLLASGMNFGFRASVPHILGISIGFLVMVVAVGVGLAEIFAGYPQTYTAMKWVGAGYLLYLAWAIATSDAPATEGATETKGKPMTFFGAAAFQWVNPKAWVMAVGAFSTYVPATAGLALIVGVAALFPAINAPSVSVWAVFGSSLRRLLQMPRYRRLFNVGMAALLVVSLVPLLQAS